MTNFMVLSATLITLALLFYSLGVWAEQLSHYLKVWHVIAFWVGFIFDTTGTIAMSKLSSNPFDLNDLHTLTGQLALWLMLIHAVWATAVVWKGSEKHRVEFHSYSLMVWMFWLIPYLGGMYMGMSR